MGKKNEQSSRMFKFITCTKNPLGGKCPGDCIYCWAQSKKGLANRYQMKKYRGPPTLYEDVLKERFGEGDFLFVVDMRDLFSPDVPSYMIYRVLDWIGESPDAWFLLLTKWPGRYLEFRDVMPRNAVLGATITSNRGYWELSKAPENFHRLGAMLNVAKAYPKNRVFLSVEPILKFDYDHFSKALFILRPWKIAVGYDNYWNRLPEPALEKTEELLDFLERYFDVERKSIRKAWWEK